MDSLNRMVVVVFVMNVIVQFHRYIHDRQQHQVVRVNDIVG